MYPICALGVRKAERAVRKSQSMNSGYFYAKATVMNSNLAREQFLRQVQRRVWSIDFFKKQ